MLHLRIVAPSDRAERALLVLSGSPSVCNVIHLEGVAKRPDGDLILADVAREDASVIISDLKQLRIHEFGSIALEDVRAELSLTADEAVREATGSPADAVIWEEVESRTSETVEISATYLIFFVLAGLIAATGIFLDSPILVVGAMVVGPEFGPIAGVCVGLIQRRSELVARSALALAVGFPLCIAAVFVATLIFRFTGITPEVWSDADHSLSTSIANPDFFAFFVAACAGAAGVLSLTTAKSGALIGVLISVTTIPAAANVGIAAAYPSDDSWSGSLAQLAINLAGILVSGVLVLFVQRRLYERRHREHLGDPGRREAGLPVEDPAEA